MNLTCRRLATALLAAALIPTFATDLFGIPGGSAVPGTGTHIDYVGDDFEDANWGFINNFPKSSREQDERLRAPTGRSTNNRWKEGPERGQPDQMEVVPTPVGGLAGSQYSLLMRTRDSGIPGRRTFTVQQDDLIVNCIRRLGMSIPVSDVPSVVARVYLPPADEWENRTGPHFGFRISASTVATERASPGLFGGRKSTTVEPYWPGIWIHFRSKTSRNIKEDSAALTVRGNSRGQDVRYKVIPADQFGWWTLGMSVTPNGQVHYYAKPGVEDLTAKDHLTSQFPYSYSAQRFRTFFFDVCNRDDGKTWSTPFVIDDPKLYVVHPDRVAANVKRNVQREARRQAQQNAKKNPRADNRQRSAKKSVAATKTDRPTR
ncbi:MAG: hypothetical protein MK171_10070 [Pirellulales bacterium]|nr:hypothetical protein [Pirellulales bacterium]